MLTPPTLDFSDELYGSLGTEISEVQSKNVLLVLTTLIKSYYLPLVLHLVKQLQFQGNKITILDVTSCEVGTSQDKWGELRNPLLDHFYQELLLKCANENLEIVCPITPKSLIQLDLNEEAYLSKGNLNECLDSFSLSALEKQGILSFFATHGIRSTRQNTPLSDSSRELLCEILVEMKYVREAVDLFLSEKSFDALLIQNGRWRSQTTVWNLANLNLISVYFFNIDVRNPMRFNFNSFPLQNLVDSQLWAKSRITKFITLTQTKREEIVKNWAAERAREEGIFSPTSSEFKHDLSQFLPKDFRYGKQVAVLFTSSSSEYDFFNEDHHAWESQAQALEYACTKLRAAGYYVILRFHPNQFNWSWYDFHDIYKLCRKAADFVVLPWDFFSSYSILKEADLVVVWESTIGLEALIAGKQVVCLKPTPYNLTANVKVLGNHKSFDLWLQRISEDSPGALMEGFQGLVGMVGIGTKLNFSDIDYCSDLTAACVNFESIMRARKQLSPSTYETIKFLIHKSQNFRHWKLLAPREIFAILEFFIGNVAAIRILVWLARLV